MRVRLATWTAGPCVVRDIGPSWFHQTRYRNIRFVVVANGVVIDESTRHDAYLSPLLGVV